MDNMDIEKIINKLPSLAYDQLEDYCVDEGKEFHQITKEELISELEWTIERMKMDLQDYSPDDPEEKELIKEARTTIRECNKIIKRLNYKERRS